jgi:hypothetical protein
LRRRPFHRSVGGIFGGAQMNRNEASRSDESESLQLAIERDTVFVRGDAPHENIETSQLRVLCVGIAGLIVVDVLILVYFWTI